MTKSEEQALKAYPECMVYNDLTMEYEDINGSYRTGFEVGYEKAEKDLSLDWVDIQIIEEIIEHYNIEHTCEEIEAMSIEAYYSEILKLYKARRK